MAVSCARNAQKECCRTRHYNLQEVIQGRISENRQIVSNAHIVYTHPTGMHHSQSNEKLNNETQDVGRRASK